MYVCIFIKLHITAQSGPVIRVILCHSHCMYVCVAPVAQRYLVTLDSSCLKKNMNASEASEHPP